MVMIACLPQAPSRSNPIANPSQALVRRKHVLERMHDVGYIVLKDRSKDIKISGGVNISSMEIEKIIIQDGRNAYIEYSDYRIVENSSYKIPFNVYLKTENFTMLINHQKAIIRNK